MSDEARERPGGQIRYNVIAADTAIGASGKSFTVSANKIVRPLAMMADVTTSATVGNRILRVRIVGSGTYSIFAGPNSGSIAASKVGGYDVHFGSGISGTTVRRNMADSANTDVQVSTVCPIIYMAAGDTLNLDDTANIDNADVVRMIIMYLEYTA